MKTIAVIVIALSSLTLKAAAVSEFSEYSAQRHSITPAVSIGTADAELRIAANELTKTESSAAGECSVICALPPVSDAQ
jgi:hypothetical protein